MNQKGLCLVVSSPSGGGKTSVIRGLICRNSRLKHSISYTTRKPREEHNDHNHYHFITESKFKAYIEKSKFYEWAIVHGHYYGTGKDDLTNLLESGFDAVLDIDVQGAQKLRKRLPNAVFIFILPPSYEELKKRLKNRASESETALNIRLENALNEMCEYTSYDYIVINDELEGAIDKIESILIAEHCRRDRVILPNGLIEKLRGKNNDITLQN